MSLRVLHCDNHLLVVFKPSGVLAQADDTGDPDILRRAKVYLKKKFDKPGDVYLGLVQRLDRPASGVTLLARTSKAAARLTAQFKAHTPIKRYLAIVKRDPGDRATWEDYLVKDHRRVRVVPSDDPMGKRARLSWRRVSQTDNHSLIDVRLFTGRPHQIRIQFASRGFPLLGDFKYGATEEFDGRNLALHCYALTIEHPVKRIPMNWTAAPQGAWNQWFRQEWTELIDSESKSQTHIG